MKAIELIELLKKHKDAEVVIRVRAEDEVGINGAPVYDSLEITDFAFLEHSNKFGLYFDGSS